MSWATATTRYGDIDVMQPSELEPRRRALAVAAVAGVLVVLVYVCAVRTSWGQRLDATAVRGRRVLTQNDIHVAARLHRTIDIASLVFLGAAIMLVALARRRPRLAIGAGVIVAGSLATTEIMKHVLGRPQLGVFGALKHTQSFPSGHTTIAMALSVGAMFVAPRRMRAYVASAGVVFAAAVGCSLIATASHRPSDPIGAALVVTAWAAVVAVFLLGTDEEPGRGRSMWLRVTPWMASIGVACLGAAFGGVVVIAIAMHRGNLSSVGVGRAFVTAAIAIVGAVTTGMAALLFVLRDAELDRPPLARHDQRVM